jgi:hypothetical protein
MIEKINEFFLTIGSKQFSLLRKLTSTYFEPSMLYRLGI